MAALLSFCLHVYFMKYFGEENKSIVKHSFRTMNGSFRRLVYAQSLSVCLTEYLCE